MSLPRNIVFLRFKMVMVMLKVVPIMCIGTYFIDYRYSLSIVLGTFFSYFIFSHFASAQARILKTKKKGLFFITYLFRLVFYAVPLIISLIFENYFNFVIILITLFSFQFLYVGIEFKRSLRKVRRNK